jgi:hypothetical protein
VQLVASGAYFYQSRHATECIFLQEDWSQFQPLLSCPADKPLTRYGEGDGSKLLCKVLPNDDDADCVIYSLGSKGVWCTQIYSDTIMGINNVTTKTVVASLLHA